MYLKKSKIDINDFSSTVTTMEMCDTNAFLVPLYICDLKKKCLIFHIGSQTTRILCRFSADIPFISI